MKDQLTPEQIEELKHKHIRSFCMRRGHISSAQEKALETLFPLYEVKYEPRHLVSFQELFGNDHPTILEIGCGMGETTAAIAKEHPELNFIGCEVYAAGVGALCMKIEQLELKNIRLFRHDAVEVMKDMIPDDSLSGIHIFFPDPWRKARHHKRRLISPSFMDLIKDKLKVGAYFHSATDWENYAEQMLEVLSSTHYLKNLNNGAAPSTSNPLLTRPTTKFNERGNRLGHGCWDFVFEKV